MPVPAKFSQQFYDKFGHGATDELVSWISEIDSTYRSQLRDLNELNFARFDAKLEQRMAEVKAELRQEIAEVKAELRTEIRTGLATLETRLVRWLFVFWVGSTVTLMGTMAALLKIL